MERRADLLLHPVRIRIVQEMAGQELTTSDLAERLTDVPQSSLYRHVRELVGADVLEVVATRPVRGTLERTYTLRTGEAVLSEEEVAELSPEEHLGYLSGFIGSVLERAAAYLTSPGAAPVEDGFGYRVVPVWATDEELRELNERIHEAVHDLAHREPGPAHRRHVLTTILVPDPSTST